MTKVKQITKEETIRMFALAVLAAGGSIIVPRFLLEDGVDGVSLTMKEDYETHDVIYAATKNRMLSIEDVD